MIKRARELLIEYGGSIAIAAVLMLAFGLRVWGLRFGLPELFHPDEWAIVDPAMTMLRTGDFNPRDFHYPTLYTYNEAIMLAFRFLFGALKGDFTSLDAVAIPGMYTWGRLMTALYGTANVFIIYKAAGKLYDRKTGIVAALFLAVAFLHLRDSHYITVDIPATALATLSFLFAIGVLRYQKLQYYILAGGAAGLATAMKWNAAPILICMLAAHFLVYSRREPLNGKLFSGLGAYIAALFIGTPYAFIDIADTIPTLGGVFAHYSSGHPGFESGNPMFFYIKSIFSQEGMSLPITLLSLIGMAHGVKRHHKEDGFIAIFPLAYLVMISLSSVTFARTALPIYPFIATYAAVAAVWMTQWVAKKFDFNSMRLYALLALFVVIVSIPAVVKASEFGIGSSTTSSRTLAGSWVAANIPKGDKLAAEFYGPPINDKDYDIIRIRFTDRKAKWFVDEKFDYLIFDSGSYQRYYDNPGLYTKEIAAYDSIFSLGRIVKVFPADTRVEPFLSPEIKIMKLKE